VKKSRRMRLAWRAASLAERRVTYMVLIGKPKGNRPLGKLDLDGENNIKKELARNGEGS
jgi:hypothetical protein